MTLLQLMDGCFRPCIDVSYATLARAGARHARASVTDPAPVTTPA